MGILQLKHIDSILEKRKKIAALYKNQLTNIKGIRVLEDKVNVDHNFAYFPIFINNESRLSRDELYDKLKTYNIFGRRYFYPLISEFPTYKGLPSAAPEGLKNAVKISKEVLCLPIYPDMTETEVQYIIQSIKTICE